MIFIYPNPFSTGITISYAAMQDHAIQLRIIDLFGQLIYKHDFDKHSAWSSPFVWEGKNDHSKNEVPAGMYTLMLTDGKLTKTARIIKVN